MANVLNLQSPIPNLLFNKEKIMSTNIPKELLYSEDDEWIRVDGDEATIGITDYAQDSLSDMVYLELPETGDSFEQGDTFGVVESVKAAADLIMPIDGEVTAVNDDLLDEPENLNEEPYGGAWMIKITVGDASQLENLMNAEAYKAHCDARS